MTADDHLDQLATAAAAAPPDVGVLATLGLADTAGLHAVIDLARRVMRDDPGAGARLARLARDGAVAAGREPEVGPAADYVLAQAAAAAGELHPALVLLDRARAGFEANGDVWAALRTNLGRTHILNEMGRHDDALAASQAVIEAVGAHPADRTEAERTELLAAAEQNSALCHELMGSFEQALAAYDRAEAGYHRAGEVRAEAEVRYDRALLLLDLGRHGEAVADLHDAAEVFRRGGFRALLAGALTHTAEAHLQRGELDRCLMALDEARDALASIEAPTGDHERALVAGRAYLELRLLPEALATFDEAARFLQESDLVIERARVQWGRGLALAGLARRAEAAAAMDAAVGQFRQSGHHGWLAGALVDRARLSQALEASDGAEADATEALELACQHGLLVAEVRARLARAHLDGGGGGPDRLSNLRAARAVAGRLPLRPLAAEVDHALGRRLAAEGAMAEAERHLLAAIEALESTRGTLSDDSLLSRYLDDRRSPYEDLLALLLAAPSAGFDADRALDVAERAKSRALGELVAGITVRSSSEPAEDREAMELRAVQRELFAQGLTPERRGRLHRRLADLEHQDSLRRLRRSERAVRRHGLADAGPEAPAGPVPADSQGPVPADPPAARGPVLTYSCALGVVHAFVAGFGPTVAVRAIAAEAEVAELVNRLRLQMARVAAAGDRLGRQLGQLVTATDGVLEQLHRLLIEPVAHALPLGDGATPLVVVPDGPLHGVPFHALHRGGRRLQERYVVSYSPSLAVHRAAPPPAPGPALVVGVADELAPQVEDEARLVAAALGDATLLLGPEATWERVSAELAVSTHLHLCGHAVHRPDNPMYSALRLADRWASAADVLRLDLSGRTVVLSACTTAGDSGHSALSPAAEVHGFVRAVLGAGASSVMASLWQADDATTTRVMDAWYRSRGAVGPAAALRDALVAVAVDAPHPYHWAPWVLIGRR